MFCLEKIISGGQTGADRAALDWSIVNTIPHGGWCPKGRKAEDGIIAPKYQLQETPSEEYAQRTQWNVRDSQGTVIFSINQNLVGGSLLTKNLAQHYNKPWLHISKNSNNNPILELSEFIDQNRINVLNVAGSRASEEPEIYQFVLDIFDLFSSNKIIHHQYD